MRNFYFIAALFFTLNCFADPVDDLVKNEMASHQIPGLTLKIVQNGKTLKTAAYGFANLEWNIPATPQTVFEIGSITKQFTAACILLLAEEGKLSVDDKISRYLTNTPPSWSDITIRELLGHTSGIKSYTELDGFELSRHLTQEQFIAKVGAQPLDFPPGEKFSYCNTGYNLLGFIIENLSGQSYWDFLTEKILRPLHMTTTTQRNPSHIIKFRADGYDRGTNNNFVNRDANCTDLFSAGEIASTVGDLMKWDAALDTEKILKNSSKQEWWTSQKLNDGKPTDYGFGWFLSPLDGHKRIWHSGSTDGFTSSNQRFPDDGLEIVVLCNSGEEGVANRLASHVAELYLAKKTKP